MPCHNNARESELRPLVTRRKISSGTRPESGRLTRDAFQFLVRTAARPGFSTVNYFQDRLGIRGAPDVPWLPDFARRR